jgi:Protein of unknown function (DUF3644)
MALVDKSIEACIAAIEIYNKPDFRYREEAFSILMLNAWELLLKARILKENKNKPRAIELWEPRTNKDGSRSKRQQPKQNRSGNKTTIGMTRAAELVRQYKTDNIDQRCTDNLQNAGRNQGQLGAPAQCQPGPQQAHPGDRICRSQELCQRRTAVVRRGSVALQLLPDAARLPFLLSDSREPGG